MGKCSNPMAYNGTDIVALPPRAFRCEPPYFREENLNVTIEVQQFHKATLKCIPDKGIPQPVITWTLPDKSSIRVSNQNHRYKRPLSVCNAVWSNFHFNSLLSDIVIVAQAF